MATKTATTAEVAWLTGAAKDDVLANYQVVGTGTLSSYVYNILLNDPGSASLYGVYNTATPYSNASTKTPIAGSSSITTSLGKVSITGTTVTLSNLTVDPATILAMQAGETKAASFYYVIWMGNQGAYSLAQATIKIVGVDDPAVITGTTSGSVVEDTTTHAGATLSISDPDHDENFFQASSVSGTYGNFSMTSGGAWSYDLDHTKADPLNDGLQVSESFTVLSAGGTPTTITINITGTNDGASISGTSTGAVSEDGSPDTVGGTLTVSDVDMGENVFQPNSGATGTYGSFTFNAGAWSYTLNNAAANVQALNGGKVVHDTMTVTSKDGTASQVIDVTITGTNDQATISGDNAGAVKEDGPTSDSGALSVSDVDDGENTFGAVGNLNTAHGSFTFTNGAWTYTLDNASVQSMQEGETTQDSLTVSSADGTDDETITVTITGTNDEAKISGKHIGNVHEDSQNEQSDSGSLNISDADHDQSSFQVPANLAGQYGTFTFNAAGDWTYTLNNSLAAVQALNSNDQLDDVLTVTSLDGSASQDITVKIHGTNEDDGHGNPNGDPGGDHDNNGGGNDDGNSGLGGGGGGPDGSTEQGTETTTSTTTDDAAVEIFNVLFDGSVFKLVFSGFDSNDVLSYDSPGLTYTGDKVTGATTQVSFDIQGENRDLTVELIGYTGDFDADNLLAT